MDPYRLPVYQQRDKILAALADHQVIVVESPTGSGKTTQIPLILHEAGFTAKGIVGVTQPRRIAAVSVSDFIARQIGTTIPRTVGYTMRFEDRTDETTLIKIMTDGILLQELKGDRDLSRYSVLMVDEAHERSLNIDFILGMLKDILARRPEFRVIVSSATINVEVFSEYFDGCPVVTIDAPLFPVQLINEPPEAEGDWESLQDKIAQIVSRIMKQGKPGDILVFLPGELAIKNCMQALQELDTGGELAIMPLYARLSHEDQGRVFLAVPGQTQGHHCHEHRGDQRHDRRRGARDRFRPCQDQLLQPEDLHGVPRRGARVQGVLQPAQGSGRPHGPRGVLPPVQPRRLRGPAVVHDGGDHAHGPLRGRAAHGRAGHPRLRVLRLPHLAGPGRDPGRRGDPAAARCPGRRAGPHGDRRADVQVPHPSQARPHDRGGDPLLPLGHRRGAHRCHLPLGELPVPSSAGQEMEARQAHHSFRDPLGDFLSYLQMYQAFSRTGNRARFCERSFLDLRTMNEILNVKGQLEEIVSAMGVPIGKGGQYDDYLCAVSRGLIQFVCERTGKGVYRSLTADRIQIHPGSLMFRENPSYIVAGEIVRTTRMYARSVSPLRKDMLSRISPVLHKAFVRGVPLKAVKEKPREPSNVVTIGAETFPVRTLKGNRKVVVMDWEKLKPALRAAPAAAQPAFKGLRGTIRWKSWEILDGMKLPAILSMASFIDPEQGIWEKWPAGKTFHFSSKGSELAGLLDNLLSLCPAKRGSRRLGFATLHTDGKGTYWFKSEKSLVTARLDSLASLECLVDEPGDVLNAAERETVARLYHELSELLET